MSHLLALDNTVNVFRNVFRPDRRHTALSTMQSQLVTAVREKSLFVFGITGSKLTYIHTYIHSISIRTLIHRYVIVYQ